MDLQASEIRALVSWLASAKKLFNRSTGTADEKEARKQSATHEIVACVKFSPAGVTGAFFYLRQSTQNWPSRFNLVRRSSPLHSVGGLSLSAHGFAGWLFVCCSWHTVNTP